MTEHFERWTQGRTVRVIGTNAGSTELPFQNWRRFKEAFAPELVREAVETSTVRVRRCLDPFGGSGTTALACQFLNVDPVTIEVNPFLADLIEAKLTRYDPDTLAKDFGGVLRRARTATATADMLLRAAPQTFLEPGVDGRWIFDRAVAHRIAKLKCAIDRVSNEAHRRFFHVLLGGILINVSNVVVSGKGRRYRRRAASSNRAIEVDVAFRNSVRRAIAEIHEYGTRPRQTFKIIRRDCRQVAHAPQTFDLAVFSPPYPNSFDYTDVYNVELWTLGYLTGSQANQDLRRSTLSSHVQISRDFAKPPTKSRTLNRVLAELDRVRSTLWNRWIPEMVGAYFSDMLTVLRSTQAGLTKNAKVWIVIGDSRYADVHIPSAKIISELAPTATLSVERLSPFRSMRASAQQGGRQELSETLLVLRNDANH